MKLVAGVDIGNATTESAIARIDGKHVTFISSGITDTTGIKGTKQNIHGVFRSLKDALDKVEAPANMKVELTAEQSDGMCYGEAVLISSAPNWTLYNERNAAWIERFNEEIYQY